MNGILSLTRFETDGYRGWSRARKDQLNAKLSADLDTGARLSLIVNRLDQPDNLDPLGLTAAQVAADRRQAQPLALTYGTRRSLENLQGGLTYEQPLSERDRLKVVSYVGTRSNAQYLAVPLTAQNAITASGGVSAFDRQFFGGSLWWRHSGSLAGAPLELTLGGEYERSDEDRTGHVNDLGERAALKRDETNRVTSWGAFIQGRWQLAPRWSLDPGLRYTQVAFSSEDRFICIPGRVSAPGSRPGTCSGSTTPITPTHLNPDDSGSQTFEAWTPVLGLVYSPSARANLYASLGRTFETPTVAELAYRPDGGTGLNLGLNPALSWHYEIGAKLMLGASTRLDLALFQIDTDDELTVATNQGGRSTYQNAPASRRRGLELRLDTELGRAFGASLAATLLDARFTESFLACAGIPCRTIAPVQNSVIVPSGNRIPGVPPGPSSPSCPTRTRRAASAGPSTSMDRVRSR